uniref:BMPH protein n=1 Tax=Fopius arisanus TaxID=64838 RepID=A0A0C9R6I9_9HYME
MKLHLVLLTVVPIFFVERITCRVLLGNNETIVQGRRRFTIEELVNGQFPHSITGDLDLDVCKAGGFLGDIALPNVQYETEWRQQKLNKSYLEELEKYRDEVLKEGLQVEEEGLTEILQFKNGPGSEESGQDAFSSMDKPVSVVEDRNQYNMGSEPGEILDRDEKHPEIKDDGIEFRLEGTTEDPKKSTLINLITTGKPEWDSPRIQESTRIPRTRHSHRRSELTTKEPTDSLVVGTTTDISSRKRQRRHHRRRNLRLMLEIWIVEYLIYLETRIFNYR